MKEDRLNQPIGNCSLALIVAMAMQFGVGGRALAASTNVAALSTLRFSPPSVTIKAGDSVTWTGLSTSHNVQTDSDPFCGPRPVPGGTCTHTFNQPGTYNYYCKPHQGSGMVGTVIVQATANTPPSVAIASPLDRSVFAAPANVTIQANASDTDGGTVTSVQFFAGANPLGADATSPFSIVANNLAAGSYALSAVATDNGGLTGTSSVVNISVVTPVAVTLSPPVINNGQFLFTYTANAGLRYVVQNSSDLRNWTPLTTNTPVGNSQQYGEAFNVNTLRFYRVGRLPNP